MTESIRSWPELGVHAILIERSGRLIYEEYFDGFDERWGEPLGRVSMTRGSMHDLRSVTKSVVSALVGIALASGAIKSLDQRSFSGSRSTRNSIRPSADGSGSVTCCP
jgi:hypothetical protein